MIIENKLELPDALVKAMSPDRHNEEGCVSATTLLKGVKEILLTDRHWDEITIDVSENLWALGGTAIHALLEKEYPDTFTEEKFWEKVGDWNVTGRIDCYDMAKEIIYDYKYTSVWKIIYKNFEDWERQGKIYAWLMKQKGLVVKECRFIALLRDWSETESQRREDYPECQIYVHKFEITDDDLVETEKFIKDKVEQLSTFVNTPDDCIPWCTKEERWTEKTKYAVMKEGRKSAVNGGVCETLEEAEKMAKELGDKHYVEERKGKDKKCGRYCPCREFCHYYKMQNKDDN
jgi:hypothetical protein